MYKIHYKYIKRKYNAKLLFTDTVKFMKLKQMIIMKVFIKKHLLDFSDYPDDTKFFDPANKKVIGKMKDEFKGKIIREFVGLKSKIY